MDQTFYTVSTSNNWTFAASSYRLPTYDDAEQHILSLSEEDTGYVERFIYEVKVRPVMKATSERVVNFGEWDGDTE